MIRTLFAFFAVTAVASAEWTDLWPADAPGPPRPPSGTERTLEGNRVTDVEVPQYLLYIPEKEKATGGAVVILPGGGYTIDSMDNEGHDYGKWLAERGILGVVVKYRVTDKDALGYGYPVPFLDARRAIRTVRANAAEWNIDPKKVGVMGSSAGGHLASLCATRFADSFEEETTDEIDRQNCRPDFAILIYPVITMGDLTHTGSRRRLLGENPSDEMIAKLSTENAVTPQTPPIFLLTTADDGVDCRNSLNFAIACKAANVPVTLHLFESGGHGYGLHGKGDLSVWPGLLDTWINRVVD